MNRRMVLSTGVMAAGLAAFTVIQALSASPAPGALPQPASLVTASKARTVAAEGRVVTYPGADVVVGAERGGRLVRLAVDEGRVVKKGELLAELEADELRATLAEARARVGEAEADVRLADQNLRRREDLAAQKVVSAHDLDQARRDLDAARARLDTARATVARYEAQLRKTRIVAPIPGTIIARHVDPGETVESGDRVVTLADLTRLRIDGEADEADAGALVVGATVEITADGYPGTVWKGRIEDVADSVTLRKLKPQDPARPTDTRVLSVKVAFMERTPLKLGTTVELRIFLEQGGAATRPARDRFAIPPKKPRSIHSSAAKDPPARFGEVNLPACAVLVESHNARGARRISLQPAPWGAMARSRAPLMNPCHSERVSETLRAKNLAVARSFGAWHA